MKKESFVKSFFLLQEFANKVLLSNFLDINKTILFINIVDNKIDFVINSNIEREFYVFSADKSRRLIFDCNGEKFRSSSNIYKKWREDIFFNMNIFYIKNNLYKVLTRELGAVGVVPFLNKIKKEGNFLRDGDNNDKKRIALLSGVYAISQVVGRPISRMVDIFSPDRICLNLGIKFSESNFFIMSYFLRTFFQFNCNNLNMLKSQEIEIFNGLGESCNENKVFILENLEKSKINAA